MAIKFLPYDRRDATSALDRSGTRRAYMVNPDCSTVRADVKSSPSLAGFCLRRVGKVSKRRRLRSMLGLIRYDLQEARDDESISGLALRTALVVGLLLGFEPNGNPDLG
jgi:hypothetical protein